MTPTRWALALRGVPCVYNNMDVIAVLLRKKQGQADVQILHTEKPSMPLRTGITKEEALGTTGRKQLRNKTNLYKVYRRMKWNQNTKLKIG